MPAAKLTNEGSFSIVTDHLGTPAEAYDAEGEKVWATELDIYGRVKASDKALGETAGETCFIPFRYQGQYHDEETGLYYNRFRYYDPSTGNYTQQDPIGLAGGNPTLYGYVHDTNAWCDSFGLNPINFTSSNGLSLEVRGYTNLRHLNNSDLRNLFHSNNNALNGRGFGLSPRDVRGNTIVLHHHRQNPRGPLHAMPARHHSISNRGQHPFGNTRGAGLTPQERTDFARWKQEFWRDSAQREINVRNARNNLLSSRNIERGTRNVVNVCRS